MVIIDGAVYVEIIKFCQIVVLACLQSTEEILQNYTLKKSTIWRFMIR